LDTIFASSKAEVLGFFFTGGEEVTDSKSLMSYVKDHHQLDEELFRNEGELTTEMEQFLEINEKGLAQKVDSYKLYIDHLEYRAEYFKNIAEQAQVYEKTFLNQIKRMKENLRFAMQNMNTDELKGEQYRFALTEPTDKLVIENENDIPVKFTKEEIVFKMDRDAIKKALQSGEQVPGAKLEITQQLRQYVNGNKKKKTKELKEVNENEIK
jgi:hypothetical protein